MYNFKIKNFLDYFEVRDAIKIFLGELDHENKWHLPMVGSLQYGTFTNCMYWFPLSTKLPIVI